MSKLGIIKPENRYLFYFAIFWVVFLAVTAYLLGSWDSRKTNPNQQLVSHSHGNAAEIKLQANRQGHYLANGTINPAMDPDMVLLGMSVLGQLNFSQQSGVLTLSLDTR